MHAARVPGRRPGVSWFGQARRPMLPRFPALLPPAAQVLGVEPLDWTPYRNTRPPHLTLSVAAGARNAEAGDAISAAAAARQQLQPLRIRLRGGGPHVLLPAGVCPLLQDPVPVTWHKGSGPAPVHDRRCGRADDGRVHRLQRRWNPALSTQLMRRCVPSLALPEAARKGAGDACAGCSRGAGMCEGRRARTVSPRMCCGCWSLWMTLPEIRGSDGVPVWDGPQDRAPGGTSAAVPLMETIPHLLAASHNSRLCRTVTELCASGYRGRREVDFAARQRAFAATWASPSSGLPVLTAIHRSTHATQLCVLAFNLSSVEHGSFQA